MKLPYSNNETVNINNISYNPVSREIIFYILSGDDEIVFPTTAEIKGGKIYCVLTGVGRISDEFDD
ncbi:hypothetical protein M1D83_03960 [Enterobacteriaceae bacterium]